MGEITMLRKSGQLREAFELGKKKLDEDPEDLWLRREFAWVLYEYLKREAAGKNCEGGLLILKHLLALDFDDSETMLGNSVLFQIIKLMNSCKNEQGPDRVMIDRLFEFGMRCPAEKPGDAYSALLETVLRLDPKHPGRLTHIENWGLKHLRDADCRRQGGGERTFPSLADRLAKTLTLVLESSLNGQAADTLNEQVEKYLSWMEDMKRKKAEIEFLPYYRARLMLLSGRTEGLLEDYRPFALRKLGEFWNWHLISRMVSDPGQKKACLSKAIRLGSKEDFLIHVRVDLAKQLLCEGAAEQAKFECEVSRQHWESRGWKLPADLRELIDSEWFEKTAASADNHGLYIEYAAQADQILIEALPEQIIVVNHINREKKRAGFLIDRNRSGSVPLSMFRGRVEPGSVWLAVLAEMKGQNGSWYKALKISPADVRPDPSILKEFRGILRIKQDRNGHRIGFVDGIFIPLTLLRHGDYGDGKEVLGTAVADFNPKKQQWGWKAVNISHSAE